MKTVPRARARCHATTGVVVGVAWNRFEYLGMDVFAGYSYVIRLGCLLPGDAGAGRLADGPMFRNAAIPHCRRNP